MTRSAKTGERAVVSLLMKWFDRNKREMPWRGESDPYRIWVSEVMLQQTQVATVIDYYNRWLAAFPTVETLAAAEPDAVLKRWEGLGYYSRARNLHRAAKLVADKGGRFPQTFDGWRALPGIGDYIAAAVTSIANAEPVGVVDGNTARVFSRRFAIETPVSTSAFRADIRSKIESGFGGRHPGWINQAWMEFGALQCKPSPDCSVCPLASNCAAKQTGRASQFPVKTKKAAVPVRKGAIYVIRRRDKTLLVRRPQQGLLGGMWELPNGLFDETPERDFLASRKLKSGKTLGAVSHAYSHFKVEYAVKDAKLNGGWLDDDGTESRWLTDTEINALPRPKVTLLALDIIRTQ
ncbi:MAG: A/G-specific adenine glycosylase [Planctomycetota bacterium]